jgi:hypothetical protein
MSIAKQRSFVLGNTPDAPDQEAAKRNLSARLFS